MLLARVANADLYIRYNVTKQYEDQLCVILCEHILQAMNKGWPAHNRM
jgi:hypothetical protein